MTTEAFNLASLVLWLITVVAAVSAAVVYALQLRAMRESIRLSAIPALVSLLESEHMRMARKIVNEALPGKAYNSGAGWTEEEKAAAQDACSGYNVVGSLARLSKADCEFVLDHWGDSARRLRDICQDYIKDLRSRNSDRYFRGLLWLADEAERGCHSEPAGSDEGRET